MNEMVHIMLKIAICEEAEKDLEKLEKLLDGIKEVKYDYDVFSSPSELLYNVSEKKERYSLYFLTLELEEMEGVKLAEEIRKEERTALIVIISETIEHIPNCLDSFIFNYLVKPINLELLMNIIKKADSYLETSRQFFTFILKRTHYCIPCEEILYIEMSLRKAYIYTTWGVVEGNLTMKESVARIDMKSFVLSSRSYLVNLRFVISVKKKEVELSNGKKIGISRNYGNLMKEKYQGYYNVF